MTMRNPFGEESLTLVAASFPNQNSAEMAAADLMHSAPRVDGEVDIVRPGDPRLLPNPEPETAGIWQTQLRSHSIFGSAGAAAGVLIALGLIISSPAATLSPFFTIFIAALIGSFIGMLFAGLVTLRPDRAFVIRKVRNLARRGRWAVIVRPLSQNGAEAAFDRLEEQGGSPVRSL